MFNSYVGPAAQQVELFTNELCFRWVCFPEGSFLTSIRVTILCDGKGKL